MANKQSLFLVSRVDSPSSRLSGLLSAKNGSAGRVHAWHNRCLFCAPVSVIRAWASFRVISSPYRHVSLPSTHADMLFQSFKIKLRNCGRLQRALRRRVPTMPHPPSLAEPSERRWGSCQPDSSSVLSSHVPSTWLNMTNSPSIPEQTQGGLLCNGRPPTCTSSALSLCKWGATPISTAHPPPKTNTSHRVDVLVY